MFYNIHEGNKSYGEYINNSKLFLKNTISSKIFNYIRCDMYNSGNIFINI